MKNIFLAVAMSAVFILSSCANGNDDVVAIRLDKTEVQLVKGSEQQLTAVTVPASDVTEFEWYSSMPEYVSVSKSGVIKAEKIYYKNDTDTEGSPVSVFCKYQGGAAECKVTVLPLGVERMEIVYVGSSSEALVLNPGEVKEVQAVFYPENADLELENLVWSTTAFEYAVVAQDEKDPSKAKITAVWPGSASIKAEYGKKSALLNLIVRAINATSVTIAGPEQVQMQVGQAMQLSASHLPANATVELGWNSLDTTVASVDYETGVVTALAEGVATIKVVAGLVEDTVTVKVSAK
jgi:uncharacterized protein YjdB